MHTTEDGRQLCPGNLRQRAPRCAAHSKLSGKRCRFPAVTGQRVCRMHGAGGSAPSGRRNGNYRHGDKTQDTMLMKAMARYGLEYPAVARSNVSSFSRRKSGRSDSTWKTGCCPRARRMLVRRNLSARTLARSGIHCPSEGLLLKRAVGSRSCGSRHGSQSCRSKSLFLQGDNHV